jgi:hypothetical protein
MPPATPASEVRIDPELAALIPPLSADELAKLEQSLRAEGCRDPLVVWAGQRTLLDGHNRYRLCGQWGLPFRVVEVELADREAARAWVIANQMSRRNLTPEAVSYLRGLRYLAEKQSRGGARRQRAGGAEEQNVRLPTAERLAAEYRVVALTIRRDAKFARAVEGLALACGADARSLILTRDARLTRRDVARLARLSPDEQRRLFAKVRAASGRPRDLWAGEEGEAPRRLVLPAEPEPLADALVTKLGAAQAAALVRLLAERLGQAEPPPRTRRRRKPR